jgi:hypothetical protein
MIGATIFLLLVILLITKMILDVQKIKKLKKENIIIDDNDIDENNHDKE